jgi:glycosyltransferase involved in cell wall biosynthesis
MAASQNSSANMAAPIISIGMPAYNCEDTIGEAIESLQSQTCADFELIISDNCSTDSTLARIKVYAAADARIRVMAQSYNRGANENYSAVARLARGTYFKWMSASDLCAPQCLEKCLEFMRNTPGAVLVSPATVLFEHRTSDGVPYVGDVGAIEDDPAARFETVLRSMRLNNLMNGLMDVKALRRTRLIEHFPGSDIAFIAKMALLGKLYLLPDQLYFRRMSATSATALMAKADVQRHHYPTRSWRSTFPRWRNHFAGLRDIMNTPLTTRQRMRALEFATRQLRWDRHALVKDISVAAGFLSAEIKALLLKRS